MRYLRWLRDPERRSARTQADAEHVKAKTDMLQLKLAEKRRELVRQSDVDALIDDLVGVTLTAMSSMLARCAPVAIWQPDAASNGSYSKCVPRSPTLPSAKPTNAASRRSANRANRPKTHRLRRRPINSWVYDGDVRSLRAQRAVPDLGLDPIGQAARDAPVFFSHQRGRRGSSR